MAEELDRSELLPPRSRRRSDRLSADDPARPDLSVVVPVYRSESTLGSLMERLDRVLSRRVGNYEVIFVDDASPDGSWRELQRLRERFPDRVVAVQLMRNFGQHNALMCGFRQVRGEVVVTLDDDLQNPPEEIPLLLTALDSQELDLVYGVAREKRHSSGRRFGSWLVNVFFRMVFRLPVTVSAFRALRRELVDAIGRYDLNYTYLDGLFAWNTQRIGQIEVEHHPREQGRSGYSFLRLLTLSLNLFTNFSLVPLQLASGLGLGAALVGFALGLYYLVLAIRGQIEVPGYASIIVAILVLGGLQLLATGLIGEYVGRLHLNVNRKPQYTIRQQLGPSPDDSRAAGDGVT